MPVSVQGPDGNTYQFPDGTDKSAAIGYFKKKGIGVKAAQEPPAETSIYHEPDWRDPLTRIEPHQAVHSASDVGREVMRGVGNVGAGALGVVLRPVSTAEGVASSIAHPIDTAKGLYRGLRDQPLETIEQGIGQTAVLDLAGRAVGPAARALKSTSEGMRRGATGTGTGATKELVKKTEADNAAEIKRAAGEREKTLAANKAADEKTMLERGKVEEHNAGLADKNAAGQSEAEQVKAQVARRSEAQKELEGISSNMDVAVEKARHDALDIGNKKYSGVNEKLNHLPADMEGVHELYQDAAETIGDVQAEPPILRRLGKSLEKGDLLTYKDQQALYSELGKELSKGTLPGSTYHAYNILHEGIGEDMQRMADSQGQGAELTEARNYWRRMKQTFGKSSDVINNRASKAVNAANPKLLKSQASDYRIRLLSSFDPKIGEMANRANALRQEMDSLPKKEPTPSTATRKDYSEPNPTKPIEKPNVKKVGEEEVRGAKTKALERRVQSIRHRGEWIATGAAGFQVLHNVMTGNFGAVPGNVLEGGIAVAGVEGITRILENPSVVKLLTEPTAKDIAQIPPEMRGDFPAILKAAKAKGIRVDPRITAVLGITALNGAKAKKLQEISDQYRSQAVQ
jgi:hypothetical protein